MKNIITSIAMLTSISIAAQTTVAQVEYTETVKMGKIEGPDGMDLSDMFPESMSNGKSLIFDGQQSVYTDSEKLEEEDLELSSDDGSFKIVILEEESTEILYLNLTKKQQVHQMGIMGKSFVVSDDIKTIKWRLETDKISYLGYECTKATGENTDGEAVVAWFTSQIPVQCGPESYHGLPGLILMVSINEGKKEIKATAIETESVATQKIKIPTDGKKVTADEFKKIEAEKTKEMMQNYGGNSTIFKE